MGKIKTRKTRKTGTPRKPPKNKKKANGMIRKKNKPWWQVT